MADPPLADGTGPRPSTRSRDAGGGTSVTPEDAARLRAAAVDMRKVAAQVAAGELTLDDAHYEELRFQVAFIYLPALRQALS